jgi:hypothetical protein
VRGGSQEWHTLRRSLMLQAVHLLLAMDLFVVVVGVDPAQGLAPATRMVTLPTLEPFQLWAPLVARFSFRHSPYVTGPLRTSIHRQSGRLKARRSPARRSAAVRPAASGNATPGMSSGPPRPAAADLPMPE